MLRWGLVVSVSFVTSAARADDPPPFQCKPDAKGCLDGEVIGVMSAIAYDWSVFPAQGKLVRNDNPTVDFRIGDRDLVPSFDDPGAPIDSKMIDGSGKELRIKTHDVHLEWSNLPTNAQLVRVRVNLGRGNAPGQDTFHADKVEVLDGTKAYPLSVSKLAKATLTPLESPRTSQGARWRSLAAKAARAAATADAANLKGFGAPKETITAEPTITWLPDKSVVRIQFAATLDRTYRKKVPNPRWANAVCDENDGPLCSHPPVPMSRWVWALRTYTAHYTYAIDYGIDGKKVATTESPVTTDAPKDGEDDPSEGP